MPWPVARNGELAAHLADLKKSEALRTSQATEIRKYLEQLNRAQGDILNRLRTLPTSPAGGDTLVKRLALIGTMETLTWLATEAIP